MCQIDVVNIGGLTIKSGFILIIDVLGFGDFVKNHSTQDVFEHYAGLITGADFAGKIVDNGNMDIMVYSDTIAIKSNSGENDLINLCRIANLLQTGQYYKALSLDSNFLPIRGVISYGEFLFHKGDLWTQATARDKIFAKNVSLIIGKPIVESYELEKEMELMCVALAKSAIDKVDKNELVKMINSNLLIQYEVPLKGGYKDTRIIVNPVTRPHIEQNLTKLNHEAKKYPEHSSTQRKYHNTIELFNFIKYSKLFYPNFSD